jgi:hypothetical protein
LFLARGNELEIVWRWFSYRAVVKILIFLLATGFAYFPSYHLLQEWKRAPHGWGMLFLVVPVAVLSIGIVLVYRLVATCLNRSCIVIGRESLSVRHGPVPWPGNLSMAIADIRFLHATHRKPGPGNKRQLAQRRIYEVHVYRRDGKIAKLVTGLDEGEQSLQIVREMEKCSGLKPVRPNPQVVPQVEDAWW